MKSLKFLFVAVILTCFIGVIQSNAQAYIQRGWDYKFLVYEIDGETYGSYAGLEYQYEWTPGGIFNWVSHGNLTESYKLEDGIGWVMLDYIALPKKTVEAYDPIGYDETVKINPRGKVTVVAHV